MAFADKRSSDSEGEDWLGGGETGEILSWADEVPEPVVVEDDDVDEEESVDDDDKPLCSKPLECSWTFWYMKRSGARTQENYEKSIKEIGSFDTVGGFWHIYNHLKRPNDLPNLTDIHLFRTGVKPVWEDDANKLGGKWIIRLKRGLASKYWEDLVLAVVGAQFDVGDEICGIVCSLRHQESILSIWNKTSKDLRVKLHIADTFKRLLRIGKTGKLEYKAHDAAMKDNSSFRNTYVYYPRNRRGRQPTGRGGRGGGRRTKTSTNRDRRDDKKDDTRERDRRPWSRKGEKREEGGASHGGGDATTSVKAKKSVDGDSSSNKPGQSVTDKSG